MTDDAIDSITFGRSIDSAKKAAIEHFIEEFGHKKFDARITKTIYEKGLPPQRYLTDYKNGIDTWVTFTLKELLEELLA